MAVAVAAIALFSCEQDRPAYSGKNYLMFSDTIYYYPVQKSNEVFQVPVSATEKPIMTVPSVWKSLIRKVMPSRANITACSQIL